MNSLSLNPQTPPMRHGRPALVTGVEHPEGAHAARTLAEHGFDVVAHSFTPEAAERIARDITSGGGRATAVVADLTIDREVDRLFTTVEDIHGHVDTVVHAAWIPGPESTGTSLETIHPTTGTDPRSPRHGLHDRAAGDAVDEHKRPGGIHRHRRRHEPISH
ncbi:SDR family NAD(P)-dependent oxidoreductase [Rhodococcus wratislaviensis]|uniref:SDR family NAD(P)-dependent oxidoreductase n=1 Tax=Rhodococcus wratislaviensis TaxID=44752 RepID=UPI001CEC08AF|nr:SDR family NAD(P)-dependent oxidoreductase [Rhodococcus wratislaviensis]